MMSKDNYKDHLYALILAGGGGTRLWPKSRNATPKQFLKLFNNQTLTQITIYRLNKMLPWERIYCVTVSEAYKREILKEVPEFIGKNIVVEPARRDTGPAHGIGAVYIYKNDPDAVIITESADRLVKPVSKYLSTLKAAAELAYKDKKLIAMGVKARYPNVGYGHIKKGKKLPRIREVKFFELDKFIEKPSLSLAKKYTASGKYFWNAGQFVWRADSILEALQKYAPEVSKHLDAVSKSIDTSSESRVLVKEYEAMPKISIDYAVAEKAKNFIVVLGEFSWTDIGDWKEVWNNLPKDEIGNVLIDGHELGGRVINLDTSDALIHTNGRLVVVVDVDNIVVVDTKNAVLVCSKSKAQNVKKIVQQLKKEGKTEYL